MPRIIQEASYTKNSVSFFLSLVFTEFVELIDEEGQIIPQVRQTKELGILAEYLTSDGIGSE